MSKGKHQRAENLDSLYEFLSPEPLRTKKEISDFYRDQVLEARGGDIVSRFAYGLRSAHGGVPYKGFLVGHQGVGKSTELTKLKYSIEDKYQVILREAQKEVDASSFQPFDVLLLTLMSIVEQTAKPISEGGAEERPSDHLLKDVWEWFAEEKTVHTESTNIGAEIAAGMGLEPSSLWAKMLGLFATLKGEARYAFSRDKQIVDYRLSRLSLLIERANRLIDECTDKLRKAVGKEFLVVWEGFDKQEFSPVQVEQLFLRRGRILQDLRIHMIFTLPISIAYSPDAAQLPFPKDRLLSIPDTPVFRPIPTRRPIVYEPHEKGRSAVSAVLDARMNPDLCDEGQLMRLIVASGGNLQDLFSMVCFAGATAALDSRPTISKSDADLTINKYRRDYRNQLGEGSAESSNIAYTEKAKRLVDIYNQIPASFIADPVLMSLLRAKAVQEFNDKGRFGVHPLVVDILASQGMIAEDQDGRVSGGTD